MRKNLLISLAAAWLFTFVGVECAFAGAWTVPQYKVYSEYYMKWNYAKEEFLSDGKKAKLTDGNDARSWEFVMEPKFEYGVTDWLNILYSMEYKESFYKEYGRPVNWGPFARKNHGLTNIKLGGKWRLIKEPIVLTTQGRVFIYPGYGNSHGDDPAFTNQPNIGRGDDAFEWRILAGKTFDIPITSKFKLPCYVNAETGYRFRTRHVCNDIPYLIEGGFWPTSWLLLKSELDGYKAHGGTGSIKESYGIWRIGGIWQVFGGDSILRDGKKLFNIEFDYGMTLWGKNTTAFQEWILKVQTQF